MLAYRKTIVTAPAAEPITSTEAKLWLKEDGTDNDALVSSLITAARQFVEKDYDCALVTQTWDLFLDGFPTDPADNKIQLGLSPVASVTSVSYIDTEGATQTWASTNYVFDSSGLIPRMVLASNATYPATQSGRINSVTVRAVCGYGAASAVPETIKTAMKLTIALWYENREDMPLTFMARTARILLNNHFQFSS